MKILLFILSTFLLFSFSPSLSFSDCVEGDCQNGEGTYTYSDGDKYVGEFKNGLPNGQGIEISSDGSKYVGGFKDGEFHGQGTLTVSVECITATLEMVYLMDKERSTSLTVQTMSVNSRMDYQADKELSPS